MPASTPESRQVRTGDEAEDEPPKGLLLPTEIATEATFERVTPEQFEATIDSNHTSTVEYHPVPHRGRSVALPPEWFILASDVVAEVNVDKIYPERYDTWTGMEPTPVPTDFVPLTPFGPSPVRSIQFTPIRFRATRLYKSNITHAEGFVVPQWNANVIEPIIGVLYGDKEPEIDLTVIHEGDSALVSLCTSHCLAVDPGAWRDYLVNEAANMTHLTGVIYRPALVDRWYRVTVNGAVLDDQLRETYALSNLRVTLEAAASKHESTPEPPWEP